MQYLLETDRLSLVPFNWNDLPILHQTFTNSFVREYLWDNEIIAPEQTKEIMLTNERHFEKDHWGLWKIMLKKDNIYIGFAGLWFFFEEAQPQLLYGLLPDYIKWGYATEASKAVMDYAFNALGFQYLVAACDTPHTDSKKVCERLGMKRIEEKEINGKTTTFYRIER